MGSGTGVRLVRKYLKSQSRLDISKVRSKTTLYVFAAVPVLLAQ